MHKVFRVADFCTAEKAQIAARAWHGRIWSEIDQLTKMKHAELRKLCVDVGVEWRHNKSKSSMFGMLATAAVFIEEAPNAGAGASSAAKQQKKPLDRLPGLQKLPSWAAGGDAGAGASSAAKEKKKPLGPLQGLQILPSWAAGGVCGMQDFRPPVALERAPSWKIETQSGPFIVQPPVIDVPFIAMSKFANSANPLNRDASTSKQSAYSP
ncbi:MAG: hypothetical protein VYB74_01660, partial [Cyanobacteriota bacterium]|nr:hypothetical protein [Cyanobacteriota bacterium]